MNFKLGRSKFIAPAFISLCMSGTIAVAQNAPQPNPPPAQPQAQAAPLPQSPYVGMARMSVEANYAGPLADTLIQRLRDPVDGTVCYLYLPISVPHGPPLEDGIMRYGANPIGSISCLPGQAGVARKK